MTQNMYQIAVEMTSSPKWKSFDFSKMEFGFSPSDHMFISEYSSGNWKNFKIIPYDNLSVTPFCSAFHYGQTVFEGMKAFRMDNGKVSIFRPYDHAKRFNRSLERMCMPEVHESLFVEAVSGLVKIDQDWVSALPEASLYIRPFMIANDPRLGVRISDNYLFMVVCSPSLAYYSKPIKVKVETKYTRACLGGTGFTKCGGNYGGSFYPYHLAKEEGYDQIIWTDAKSHKYVEESGTMNLGFISNKVLYTPPLGETILQGITRDSILKIAPLLGLKVTEKRLSLTELDKMLRNDTKTEAFGIGTAATIAPIKEITIDGKIYNAFTGDAAMMYKLKNYLDNIRLGRKQDVFNWNKIIQ